MYCTSCGNQLKEGQKFCPKCGTPSKAATKTGLAQNTADKNLEKERLRQQAEQKRIKEEQEAKEREAAREKRQQEEAEKRLAIAKAEEERKKQEELQRQAELERKAREEAENAARKQLEQRERKRMEEMRMPLPDSILLAVRTSLLEHGVFNQEQVDDIYRKTRAAGIDDARTKFQLESELERFEKRTVSPVVKEKKKPKRSWVGLVWFLGILLILALLVGFGYVFRLEVLNTLDNWGLQTTALRGKLGVESQTRVIDTIMVDKLNDAEVGKIEEPDLTAMEESDVIEDSVEVGENEHVGEAEISTKAVYKPDPKPEPVPKTPQSPKIYSVVDVSPEYPGGTKGLQSFIERNMRYPVEARRKDQTGTVFLKYEVTSAGSIGEVQVIRGVAPSLDQEAVRIIKSISGYSPGYKDGKAVSTYQNTKVRFML